MLTWLHTFEPQAIAFSFGVLTVHWYGLFMVAGISAGIFVLAQLAPRVGFSRDDLYNLAFYVIIFSLVGARIYAVFLEGQYYLANPGQIIAVWNGGLAIHGALIGSILTVIIYTRRKGQSFWQWVDIGAVALPFGQFIGRWGNYFNQELFGRPTELAWGIPISLLHRPPAYARFTYFHPTFLYESLLNLLNFIIMLTLFAHRKKLQLKTGTLFLIYLINYSIIRIITELFRVDPTPVFVGLRLPTIVSSLVIIVAGGVLIYRLRQPKVPV